MRRGRQRRFQQAHRNPPMPWWFGTPQWGICRWCNNTIFKNDSVDTRRKWHPACLHDWSIIADNKYAKRCVKKRDKGICAKCGKYCHYRYEWQADHINPLIDANGDLDYWRLGNLATMCIECHLKKTIEENEKRTMDRRKNIGNNPKFDS